jgi:hypothetical protein
MDAVFAAFALPVGHVFAHWDFLRIIIRPQAASNKTAPP